MTAIKEIGKRKLIDGTQTTVLIEGMIVMIVVGTRRFVDECSVGCTRNGKVRAGREKSGQHTSISLDQWRRDHRDWWSHRERAVAVGLSWRNSRIVWVAADSSTSVGRSRWSWARRSRACGVRRR